MNELIYRGRVVNLAIEDAALPNGVVTRLEVMHHPGAAAAVPLHDDGTVTILRQWRHAAGGWLWEVPAGKLDKPGEDPLEVFQQAVDNVKPHIEVRSKRVGGASYQVPMPVSKNRQLSLAIRWILLAIREKKGRATSQKLAEELMAAFKREGAAVTRRDNVHRMADANKAFAHFAW